MGLHSLKEMQAALDTTERILSTLRKQSDPDYALRQIIEAVENQQAELLASLLDSRAAGPTTHADTQVE
jgi:hypothetical protein